MIAGARSGFVFLFVVGVVACGGEAPQVVTPPPLHITATPPQPPQRARWIFSHPERGLVGKLDLGDGNVLYIGQNGRRELAKKDDPLVDAPTLALGDLIGVMKTPKGEYAFVAGDGTVFTSKEPLGNLENAKPGPIGPDHPNTKLGSPTTGKAAILGIHPDGRLMRSADYGNSWQAVDYTGGNKPYGKLASIVLDSKGNGVALHFPQRLFVTHDDGASWSPLASNHMGVRSIQRDGKDRIFVNGMNGVRATLDGNALAPTSDYPKSVYEAPKTDPAAAAATNDERSDSKTILTGDRVVEFAEITRHGKVREVQIASAALGDKPEKPASNTDLVGANGMSKHIAGFGKEIVYLRDDDDADENAPTTTLYRSKDYGATWQKESQLQGVDAAEGEGIDIAAGPKGWVYVTSLCPKDESSGSNCSHKQIRPADAKAFEDMAFTEEFEPKEFAFDETGGKVYAIGLHEGHQYVYESPLAQNKFSRTKLLDANSYTKAAISVDGKGVARVFEFDNSKQNWVLHKLGADGKEQSLYIAAERGTIALTGSRGIIFAGRDHGWETNDGGESWMRVATNGFAHDLVCSDAGCVNGDAQRVGWDLPAITNQEKVTAQTDPVKPPTNTPHVDHPPPITPKEIACKVSGTAQTVSSTPSTEMVDGVGADRWATVKHDTDSKISIVVGTKNAVRELPLLAALPKPAANAKPPANPEEMRAGERTLNDGVVAARYRFAPRTGGGGYNPVDVELAWWSSVTGKTMHHTLPKVAAFRVSRYGFSGAPQIVDGGLLFQGASSDSAYFIHDDGKVETLPMPKNGTVHEAELVKKRWLLADTEGPAVQISSSDDNGKTWKQTAWGLDNYYGTIGLQLLDNKTTVSFASNYASAAGHTLLFPIDATLADDPPAPIVIDATQNVDTPCDAKAGRHRFTQYIQSDRRPLRISIDTGTFSPSQRVLHDASGGKTCTSAYISTGYTSKGYETAFVYPEANGTFTGWRFRRPDDRNKTGMVAEPLTCK
jgi:photosystem II stability/assembly factor-like uncharacterized protein